MGRGKVQLKRIENKNNRQVTFSKRRTGLMKKARELSVLCDVDVALIVFSAKGRFYEFHTGNSLQEIIECYKQRIGEEADVSMFHDTKVETQQAFQQKRGTVPRTGAEILEMVRSQVEGPKMEELSLSELIQLEQKLDVMLRQTRRQKERQLEAKKQLIEKMEKQLEARKQHMGKKTGEAWSKESRPVMEEGGGNNGKPPPQNVLLQLL